MFIKSLKKPILVKKKIDHTKSIKFFWIVWLFVYLELSFYNGVSGTSVFLEAVQGKGSVLNKFYEKIESNFIYS